MAPMVRATPRAPNVGIAMRVLDVVCLCAAWCGTCREYEAVFEQLRANWPQHRFHWIDIEDEAERLGEVDVETFPTLVLIHEGAMQYAAALPPRLADASRLIDAYSQAQPPAVQLAQAESVYAELLRSMPGA